MWGDDIHSTYSKDVEASTEGNTHIEGNGSGGNGSGGNGSGAAKPYSSTSMDKALRSAVVGKGSKRRVSSKCKTLLRGLVTSAINGRDETKVQLDDVLDIVDAKPTKTSATVLKLVGSTDRAVNERLTSLCYLLEKASPDTESGMITYNTMVDALDAIQAESIEPSIESLASEPIAKK